MADDFINIEYEGWEEIQARLKKLPPVAIDSGSDSAYNYLLTLFRREPPQRKVTRKQAYGVSFFSARQRRWFFAALNSGEISVPYKRTHGLINSWHKVGSGRNAFLINDSYYAPFIYGDKTQSRMAKLIGWKTVGEILGGRRTLAGRAKEVLYHFNAGVKNAIRKLGL